MIQVHALGELRARLAEVEAERDQWQEDARRFCLNADYWRERAAARGEGDRG